MFQLSVPWWELVIRALVVFSFILIALRLTGKRQIGQMAPFDLVLLLVLSNAVQNSMNAGDNSLVGGLISAATLLGLDYVLGWAAFKNKRISKVIEGHPEVLVHRGKVMHQVLRKEQMTLADLEEGLRKEGVASPAEVEIAILENTGQISVIKKKEA
jgi:uncharacterized membrane protein YcaP (DUF421 family)